MQYSNTTLWPVLSGDIRGMRVRLYVYVSISSTSKKKSEMPSEACILVNINKGTNES